MMNRVSLVVLTTEWVMLPYRYPMKLLLRSVIIFQQRVDDTFIQKVLEWCIVVAWCSLSFGFVTENRSTILS